MSLRVGIDLDGVLYDFGGSLERYLWDHDLANKYTIGPVNRWEFYLDWGMTEEEFIQHCHDGVDAGYVFYAGAPHEGSKSALEFIRAMGNTLHIITDRTFGSVPENSQHNTRTWLNHCDIPYDTLTFSADKTCVPTDFFIEDKLENYDALDKAGVEVYLVNRPWNQVPGDKRRRVASIQQFASIVGFAS